MKARKSSNINDSCVFIRQTSDLAFTEKAPNHPWNSFGLPVIGESALLDSLCLLCRAQYTDNEPDGWSTMDRSKTIAELNPSVSSFQGHMKDFLLHYYSYLCMLRTCCFQKIQSGVCLPLHGLHFECWFHQDHKQVCILRHSHMPRLPYRHFGALLKPTGVVSWSVYFHCHLPWLLW